MTATTAPTEQIIQDRATHRANDLAEARRTYADLVAALATQSDSPLGGGDIDRLLSYLKIDDQQLRSDVDRAMKMAASRAAAERLDKLATAKQKAAAKYDKWQNETERLIAEREPKRAELAGRFHNAENELAAAERLSRQPIDTATPPPAWQKITSAIADCRTRSSQANNRLQSAIDSIGRRIERLNHELASASAKDAESINAQLAEFQTPFHRDLQKLHEHWLHRQEQFAEFAELINTYRDPATGLWIGPDVPPAEWRRIDTSRLEIAEHLPA